MAIRGWKNNNGELKYLDTGISAGMNSTGSVTALNLLAVGDDNTTRDGRQITAKSVHIQGFIQPEDQTVNSQLVRWLLVWDSQPNSSTIAAIGDILVTATSISHTNLNNRERFTILRDQRFAVGFVSNVATQAYAVGPGVHVVNEFVPLKELKTTYSGTTAVIGAIATGALLLVLVGTEAGGTAATFNGQARLRFFDH